MDSITDFIYCVLIPNHRRWWLFVHISIMCIWVTWYTWQTLVLINDYFIWDGTQFKQCWVHQATRQASKVLLQHSEATSSEGNNCKRTSICEWWGVRGIQLLYCRKDLSEVCMTRIFLIPCSYYLLFFLIQDFQGLDYKFGELLHHCFTFEEHGKVYSHYNFTIEMKKKDEQCWTSNRYFAEAKLMRGVKYYFCSPLEATDDGECCCLFICKNWTLSFKIVVLTCGVYL